MEENKHNKRIRVRKSVSTKKQKKEPQRGVGIAKLEEDRKRKEQMQAFLIPDRNEIPIHATASLVNPMNPSSNQSFDSNSSLIVPNNERVYPMNSIDHSIKSPSNQSLYNNLSSPLLHNERNLGVDHDAYALNKSDESRSHGNGKAPYVYYDNKILRDLTPSSSTMFKGTSWNNGEYVQPAPPIISPYTPNVTARQWYLAHQVNHEDPLINSREQKSSSNN